MAALDDVDQSRQKPGSQYVLPRDEIEANRLNLQNEVIKSAFDDRVLFPPYKPEGSYFILDSGTGTGIWLNDVSRMLSQSAVLHGFDVNDRMFPPVRPKNMSLSLNTMTNLPEEWADRFDFINQRFLIAALTHGDWLDAIPNLTRALRPGGWVQLMEPVMWRSGPITAKHVQLVQALFNVRGMDLGIHERLPQLLLEEGYVNIQTEYRQVPLGKWKGKIGETGRDVFMGTYRGMKGPILLSGGLGFVDGEEQLDDLFDQMEAEWDKTEGSELTMCVVYAQKPQVHRT